LAVCGWSQSVPPASFRADATLVLVPVTVTDSANRYVLGLGPEHFGVLEDGVAQKITSFSTEDSPLSLGLLVDTSGSIGAKLETSRRAVGEVLKTMNNADEAFLVEFNERAKVTLPLTHDMKRVESRLGTLATGGLTAMLDAIEQGLGEMKRAGNPRKALLIISDGGDNNSRYTQEQIQALVREADVQIYVIGVFEPYQSLLLSAAELDGPRLLSELAEQTGGRAVAAVNNRELPGIAARIAIELRNQYVIAYSPANQTRDGKYRRVQVTLQQPASLPPLKARWRQGYYAPGQ
jgi:VWFA-related protein